MYKMVNNERVKCSPAEEALIMAQQSAPIDINAQKLKDAQSLVNTPQMLAAIEEFTAILKAASVTVPPAVVDNIVNRTKAKL